MPPSADEAHVDGRDADHRWPSARSAAGDTTGAARRTRRREARREAILEVAAPLFLRKGFASTSLDDVATALGLTRPAIYHYFPDKHRILLEIVERGFANLSSEARAVAAGGGSAVEKLERIFTMHLTRVAADPQAVLLVITEAGDLAPAARGLLRRRQLTYERVLTELFEQAMDDGDMVRSDPALLIKAFVSLANWVYAWYNPRGAYRPEEIARFFWAMFAGGAAAPGVGRAAASMPARRPRPRRPQRSS